MTAWPDHLLTLEEFAQLPEDTSRHVELVEGVLHVSPQTVPIHQRIVARLLSALNGQLPSDWEALPEVEVVLSVPST